MITKVQTRFPLTLKKTTARLSTYHPNNNYSRVSPSELVEGVGVLEPSSGASVLRENRIMNHTQLSARSNSGEIHNQTMPGRRTPNIQLRLFSRERY